MDYYLANIKSTYFYRHLFERLHIFYYNKKNYGKYPILDGIEANEYIKKKILGDKPFFITRLGGNECEIIRQYLQIKHKIRINYSKDIIETAKTGAGIFPSNKKILSEVAELYLKDLHKITSIGVWHLPMEEYIILKYSKPETIMHFNSLYPLLNDWTSVLKGKKVLVVHPFEKTIISQYKKREKIIKGDKLPSFHLLTYKPVVSLADEIVDYPDWFSALEKMKKDIKNIDFEIALIGCGAYGLPLASFVFNEMNKKVIHVGGSLQLLFGIKGQAYLRNDSLKNEMNQYWVFPSEEETPSNSNIVENSCYWK